MVQRLLAAAHGWDAADIDIRVITTSGDRIQDRLLAEVGGKGLFTKEIEEALLSNEIDLAVHSAKDLPTVLPLGLALAACPPREDVRDALICLGATSLGALPAGARLGTASLRRQAIARRLRPDLQVFPLRGNVETRLRKLEAGEVDATILALAGLRRLGLADRATCVLPVDDFLPAAGQGAVAIEIRESDPRVRELVAAIDHAPTSNAIAAERAFLDVLDGSCRTPIGAYAAIEGGVFCFRGMIVRPDGSEAHQVARTGDPNDAAALGADAGNALKRSGLASFLQS